MKYHIEGSSEARPPSNHTLFVDGTAEGQFRDQFDLELSHWKPNRTPVQYKADTSTEICLKFVKDNPKHYYDLVVNNHLDVDGILSLYVILNPKIALKHAKVLTEAAAIGDFWAHGSEDAMGLFQSLSFMLDDFRSGAYGQPLDPNETCQHCFDHVTNYLKKPSNTLEVLKAKELLAEIEAHIEAGRIQREEYPPHFVHYHVTRDLSEGKEDKYLKIPRHNEVISDRLAFWPQARNKQDLERVHLVSVEGEKGTYFDLWYPGYLWAEAPNLWSAPGLINTSTADPYKFSLPPLHDLLESWNDTDNGRGGWKMYDKILLQPKSGERGFPIVASYAQEDGTPVQSDMKPTTIALGIAAIINKEAEGNAE